MDTVDIKLHILRARARRLNNHARRQLSGLIGKIETARAALALHALHVLTAPAQLVAGAVDEVSRASEAVDRELAKAFRYLSRHRTH